MEKGLCTTMCSEKTTLKMIEDLRRQLAKLVQTKGYTNIETIKISQQLDGVLNRYTTLQQRKH